MCSPKLFGCFELIVDNVHGDDRVRAETAQELNRVETDAAATDNQGRVAGFSPPRCLAGVYAVVTRQPTMLASSMDISPGIRNTMYAGTDTYSAKPPTFQRLTDVPSGFRSAGGAGRLSQRFSRAVRQ